MILVMLMMSAAGWSANASAAELLCEAKINMDHAWDRKVTVPEGEKVRIDSMEEFTAYVKSAGGDLYELEVLDLGIPARHYAEGPILEGGPALKWTLWTRDILLEVSCRR